MKLEVYEKCIGYYPFVWEFNYLHNVHVRKEIPLSNGDSDYGHTLKDQLGTVYIVAPTEALALAAWEHKWGQYKHMYTYKDHKKLFAIDAFLKFDHL